MFGLFQRYKTVILLTVLYWTVRLVNLPGLPIYNDEAIYLDWGWREIHIPGYLFYSLYDAKPPLLMWVFGIASSVLPDPLLAGRLVGVFFGYGTLLGIYSIGRRYFSQRVGILAGLCTITNPLLSFFDRQALMESSLGAVGIWMLYAFLRYCDTKRLIWIVSIGTLLGLGFFIKTNALLFGIAFLMLSIGLLISHRLNIRQTAMLIGVVVLIFILLVIPLLLQPDFWKTFHTINRYSLTLSEIGTFPFHNWIQNFIRTSIILLLHTTPFLFFAAGFGFLLLLFRNNISYRIIGLWFILCMGFVLLTARNVIERYVVSFIPLMGIFAAYQFDWCMRRARLFAVWTLGMSLLCMGIFTAFQIASPVTYIRFFASFSPVALREYVFGVTSGIGIDEAVDYLREQAGGEKTFVGFALNTGTPESAVIVKLLKDPSLTAGYLDARYMNMDVAQYDCLVAPVPVYFVSREEEKAGLDKFLEKKRVITNPYGGNTIGIYKLVRPCEGRTKTLHFETP